MSIGYWGAFLKKCLLLPQRREVYARVVGFPDDQGGATREGKAFADDLQQATARGISLLFLVVPGGAGFTKVIDYFNSPGLDWEHRLKSNEGEWAPTWGRGFRSWRTKRVKGLAAVLIMCIMFLVLLLMALEHNRSGNDSTREPDDLLKENQSNTNLYLFAFLISLVFFISLFSNLYAALCAHWK